MRITTALAALLVLSAFGCTSMSSAPPAPVVAGPVTEMVPLKVWFDEQFPDADGAKRVVLCQLNDERAHKNYLGEGPVAGDPTMVAKYVTEDDPTLVMPRVLARELKSVNLNVALAERLGDPIGGTPVRDLIARYNGDYVIAGRIEELTVRARAGEGQPVLVVASARLDIYNKDGELRMYYPAKFTDAAFLGEKAGDPEEMSRVLNKAVFKMFDSAMDDAYFLKALDLDNQAVRTIRAAKPLCPQGPPAGAKPASPKPDEVKPLDTTPAPAPVPPAEKTEANKKAMDLEAAVRTTSK